ncbi:type II DNA topoisomerase VI subunit A 2 [Emiliania huxleyi CCMP1516]|uniref:DNA topoisomerase (ATP-hydrolyzing) n=2 Tax=Emiliania huxleyi TaxID=2903 RepID=A0A0D3IT42_EMIH1|nr:type II DNA topoisomerase VI subunit A 2 [Emiliania huxleyi CCMP1516]EOD14427.1 type II DNA topoisomerase VI subunit A 2 [Emiliania huxleyi CCMP1516]|eukprot:XP_005766856.1 type II DNA topoisomerase VI subunit A 2 [Emiliania huxleyi CCMP1516]
MDAAGSSRKRTLEEVGVSGVSKEVQHMGAEDVSAEIEAICMRAVASIMRGDGFSYMMPSRVASNQMYVKELDRVVLKEKMLERVFSNASSARKTATPAAGGWAITTRLMQIVLELCSKGIHVTKRDLFYTGALSSPCRLPASRRPPPPHTHPRPLLHPHVKLFKQQTESDDVLDDVACMAGPTTPSLDTTSPRPGIVVGKLIFEDDGDTIDCTKMGMGGKARHAHAHAADLPQTCRLMCLRRSLVQDRFYNDYPCVIISGTGGSPTRLDSKLIFGQPDVATRLFLNKVRSALNVPILGLFDADPYGLKILSGSKNMSYDSINLTTPDIKWLGVRPNLLGVRPSDLDKYSIPQQCRLEMSEHDLKTGRELLEEDFIKANPKWHRELELMVKTKALSSFGFQYLSKTYLPRKLKEGDWI